MTTQDEMDVFIQQLLQERKEHLERIKQGVHVWNRWRETHSDIHPDLGGADLCEADLCKADLHNTTLLGANLRGARLRAVNLRGALLRSADLFGADLREAHLDTAWLFDVDLREANLCAAFLEGAVLDGARMGATILGNVDLSRTEGLSGVQHERPSIIGLDTIARSHGEIPAIFLRRAGVPKSLIALLEEWRGGHACSLRN